MSPRIAFSENFAKTITDSTGPFAEFFIHHETKAYIVGGFIRDSLIGIPCHDIDIVVKGDPQLLATNLAKQLNGTCFLLDPDHNIYRVLVKGDRQFNTPSTNHNSFWNVDLAPFYGSIEEDLYTRDFTINAIALDLTKVSSGISMTSLTDPTDGIKDLLWEKQLRSVSTTAIQTDPIRILRGVRIGARLGLSIAASTTKEMELEAVHLSNSAPERIRNEFLNILSDSNASNTLSTLDALGVLHELFPQLSSGKGVSQPFEHYWDVFNHSIEAVRMTENILNKDFREQEQVGVSIPWEPWLHDHFSEEVTDGYSRSVILKLTALLHDIAKPATKTLDHTGRARFLGHTNLGASMCEDILKRLRLSRKGIYMVTTMVEQHLRPGQLAQRGQRPTSKAIYRYFRDLGDVAVDTLYLNLADYLAAKGPNLDLNDWYAYCGLISFTLDAQYNYSQVKESPKFVNGHDLITLFKQVPGPQFGTILEKIQEAQSTGKINSREEALNYLEKTLSEERMGVANTYV